MSTNLIIILLALLSGITTLIGLGLAFLFKKSKKGICIGLGFSTGIMLAISFFELLPEAVKATTPINALISSLLGFLLIASLHYILPHTHLIKEKGKLRSITRVAFLVAFGLILHDLPEGFAMANSYILAPALGILVALSIALHNIPEEFAMAVPLVMIKRKSYLITLALLSALAEPLGAIAGIFAVSLAPALNPLFLAFAAGAMIYVSLDELLPLADMYRRMGYFAIGIVISLLVYFLLAYYM